LYVDWFQLTWNEWVINYDFARQTTLARNVGQISTDWKEAWRNRIQRAHNGLIDRLMLWQVRHPWLRFSFPILMVAVLLVLRMEWFRRFIDWLTLRFQLGGSPKERNNPQLASRMYSELLRVLEKRGFTRSEGQTPREFAARLARQPALGPMVNEFTDLYAQARFGSIPCDAFRLRTLLDQVRATPRPR
jgi:hypothetical protein